MNKIAILEGHTINASEKEISFLEQYGEVRCFDHTFPTSLPERLRGVSCAFIDGQEISACLMDQCPDLKYIGIMATGTDSVDLSAAAQRGIAVTNAPAYGSASVAQHTFALILYLTNRVDFHIDRNRTAFWAKGEAYPFWDLPQLELSGKTLGIAGFGAIGQQVASIGMGFGMRILAATGHPTSDTLGNDIQFTDLETMLAESHIISLHKPMSEHNKHLINRRTLSRMKDGAILINTARGGLIDEIALADALRAGKLKAAALDVLTQEPPENENPLLGLPNCVITPHLAWVSLEACSRLWTAVADNFTAWQNGEIRNRV